MDYKVENGACLHTARTGNNQLQHHDEFPLSSHSIHSLLHVVANGERESVASVCDRVIAIDGHGETTENNQFTSHLIRQQFTEEVILCVVATHPLSLFSA